MKNNRLQAIAPMTKHKTPKAEMLQTARKSRAAWVLLARDKIRTMNNNASVAQVCRRILCIKLPN